GRWQNVVHTVTACAIGNDFRSELRSQSVIAVAITADASTRHAEFLRQRHAFMTLRAAIGPDARRNRILGSIKRHQDVVYAVAVGTDGRTTHAASQSLPVNTLHEFVGFGSMALAARVRNVDFRDCRLLIRSRLNVVAVVAVRADGGAHIAARDRFRVHAFAISKQRPIADAASLHHRLVAMTTAASLSDISAID